MTEEAVGRLVQEIVVGSGGVGGAESGKKGQEEVKLVGEAEL